ncbi:MAG TPA: SDR family NAD(P)-dependent oxidoreductase [Patescibacteria group bacterium]|nr:SDR family NAD(P)-dependent oxidoreductase [Patescibacteria group bacterium]
MPIRLGDQIVVVTGASSGIGRATAQAFARRGATLVLAARGVAGLEAAALECRELGGRALVVTTDVGDEAQMRRLADRAMRLFGRIDVWINGAAVGLYGRIEEVPGEAVRQVIQTNLLGTLFGTRIALPIFREQGRGVLINIASVEGCVGQPYSSIYAASKWAVRGVGECLRMEVADAPGISVCTVLPGAVDTPLFQHAANYTGRAVQPLGRPLAAVRVAEEIVAVAGSPRRNAFIGADGIGLLLAAKQLAPGLVERGVAARVERNRFLDRPVPRSAGNLTQPLPGAVGGGWRRAAARRRGGGRLLLPLAVAALVAVPLGLLVWRQSRARA